MRNPAAVLLALALFALAPFAEEPDPRLRGLVAALGSEGVEEREAAERDLLGFGEPARGPLEAELEQATDPEVRARLRRILRRLDVPQWRDSLADALAAAKARGKMVVVIQVGAAEESAFGPFMQMTLELESVSRTLAGTELVWDGPGKPGTEPQRPLPREAFESSIENFAGHQGLRDLRVWFLAPDGKVRHFLQGWWGETRLNEEIVRAREFLALPLAEVRARRAAIVDQLQEEFAASTCGNARRHLGPWQCGAAGCVLRRLSLIYAAGTEILDQDASAAFPEPWQPGEGPAAVTRRR